MDEQTKALLNALNGTSETAEPQNAQNQQTDTEKRLDDLEQAVTILLTGVTE